MQATSKSYAVRNAYLGFLSQCARTTAPYTEQILNTRAFDSLLLTDPASDGGTAVEVEQRNELRQSIGEAALAQRLSVPSELDAGADERQKTCTPRKNTIKKLLLENYCQRRVPAEDI